MLTRFQKMSMLSTRYFDKKLYSFEFKYSLSFPSYYRSVRVERHANSSLFFALIHALRFCLAAISAVFSVGFMLKFNESRGSSQMESSERSRGISFFLLTGIYFVYLFQTTNLKWQVLESRLNEVMIST